MTLMAEMHLIHQLQALGLRLDPFAGISTREERREVVRATITKMDNMSVTIRGKQWNLRTEFERAYGCPL